MLRTRRSGKSGEVVRVDKCSGESGEVVRVEKDEKRRIFSGARA